MSPDTATLRASACEGKKVFKTYTHADKQARRQSSRKKGGAFSAYNCKICGQFHVGTRLGGVAPTPFPDARQRYQVYAKDAKGREHHLGFSDKADGGAIAWLCPSDWIISRVIDREKAR